MGISGAGRLLFHGKVDTIMIMRMLLMVLALAGAAAPAAAETAWDALAPGAPLFYGRGPQGREVRAGAAGRLGAAQDRLAALYQERLSVLDGARCMFHPTCSAFFREALRDHGPLWATLMVIDRLLYRENRASLYRYPETGVGERRSDPVRSNYIFAPADYLR